MPCARASTSFWRDRRGRRWWRRSPPGRRRLRGRRRGAGATSRRRRRRRPRGEDHGGDDPASDHPARVAGAPGRRSNSRAAVVRGHTLGETPRTMRGPAGGRPRPRSRCSSWPPGFPFTSRPGRCPSPTTTRSPCSWRATSCAASSPRSSGTSPTTARSTPTCSPSAPGVAGHHAVFRAYEAVCGLLLVAAPRPRGRRGRGCGGPVPGRLAAAGRAGRRGNALHGAHGRDGTHAELPDPPARVGARCWPASRGSPRSPSGRGSIWRAPALLGLRLRPRHLGLGARDPALWPAPRLGLVAAGWRPRALDPRRLRRRPRSSGPHRWSSRARSTRLRRARSPPCVPRWLWTAGLRDLLRAAAGLFGLQVPLVVDGPERASLPCAAVLRARRGPRRARRRRCARAARACPFSDGRRRWPPAFALSRRTGGDEVRYLYGLTVPVLALAGVGVARLGARAPVAGRSRRARRVPCRGCSATACWPPAWRDPAHASLVWQVPPLEPVLASLRRAGRAQRVREPSVRGAPAPRVRRVGPGQPGLERADPRRPAAIPRRGGPRPARGLDPLVPPVARHAARGRIPRSAGFGSAARWHEDVAGEFSVFRAFRPPYDEARPVPAGQMEIRALDGALLPDLVRDRDPGTAWTSPQGIARGSGLAVRAAPRRLSALVLRVPLDPTPLGARWVCEADGVVVASGPLRHTLQWVNGAPRAGRQALLAVVLPGTSAREVRLIFQDAGPPLGVIEVFLYGPDEEARAGRGRRVGRVAPTPPRDAAIGTRRRVCTRTRSARSRIARRITRAWRGRSGGRHIGGTSTWRAWTMGGRSSFSAGR